METVQTFVKENFDALGLKLLERAQPVSIILSAFNSHQELLVGIGDALANLEKIQFRRLM